MVLMLQPTKFTGHYLILNDIDKISKQVSLKECGCEDMAVMWSVVPGSRLPSARKCEDRLDSGTGGRDEVPDDPHSLAPHATVPHQT